MIPVDTVGLVLIPVERSRGMVLHPHVGGDGFSSIRLDTVDQITKERERYGGRWCSDSEAASQNEFLESRSKGPGISQGEDRANHVLTTYRWI